MRISLCEKYPNLACDRCYVQFAAIEIDTVSGVPLIRGSRETMLRRVKAESTFISTG